MSFIKKHYEKIILAVLLLVFVLLLGFQIMIILKARNVDIDSVLGIKPPAPDYKKIAQDDAKYNLMPLLENKFGRWARVDVKEGESDLGTPAPLIRCPFGLHLIPVTDFPKQNAKAPGKCSYCGKEIRVLISDLMITEDDSDGDGIPDKWEIQHGLNPKDPNDAKLDNDKDGFTNLEEYLAGTNPNDPKSRPTYAKKLYVTSVVSVPLWMRLKYFGNAGENVPSDKWEIQIELLNKKGKALEQQFKAVGETVVSVTSKKTYIIKSIQVDFVASKSGSGKENQSRIILYEYDPKTKKEIGQQIIGNLGADIVDPRKQVTFEFTVDGVEKGGFVGDTIEFGDEQRGIDKFIIKSGNDKDGTAQLQTDNGIIETIQKKPALLNIDTESPDMDKKDDKKTRAAAPVDFDNKKR